ncbi:MAG TPA: MFS transporter [Candidatus Limnocylindrales bacterium]
MLAGPGVAGLLVQAIGAPLAILANVCSYLASAIAVRRIRAAESRPTVADARTSIGSELLLGFRYIFRSRFLRWLMTASAISNMAVSCLQDIYFIVALDLFGLSIATASTLLAASGIGHLPR